MAEFNKDCCANPAVPHNYSPKGKYATFGGLKTCESPDITSPVNAPKCGIFAIYDVFGYYPQTLQGADRLAASTNAVVAMPDFFKGEPLPLDAFPTGDDQRKIKAAAEFMATKANLGKCLELLMEVRRDVAVKYESVKAWGIYGLCWGGKLAILASGEDTQFIASAQAHPGRIAEEDALNLTIPHICLFSQKDGEPENVEKYKAALKTRKDVEIQDYSTMQHGWMGARGFYNGEESVKGFEKGYRDSFISGLVEALTNL